MEKKESSEKYLSASESGSEDEYSSDSSTFSNSNRLISKSPLSLTKHSPHHGGILKHKTLDMRKYGHNSRKRSKYKMLNPEIKRQAVNLVSV